MIATKQIEIEQGDLIYVVDSVGTRIVLVALDAEYVVPCPSFLSGFFGISQRFKLSSLGEYGFTIAKVEANE